MAKRKPAVSGEDRAQRLVQLEDLKDRLPSLVANLNRLEDEKRLANKIVNGDIKAAKEAIADLMGEIKDVLYVDAPDFAENVVRTYRIDTGEVVSSRAMTPAERQMELDRADPNVPAPQPRAADDIEAELDRKFGAEDAA